MESTSYPRQPQPEHTLLALRLHEGPEDEAAQIAAALQGDPTAQAWIVQRWSAPVYRYALRMLHNEQDARDAAQDTLVKVLRKLHTFDRSRKLSTWIFGICRNTCIDEHRRRKRRAWDEPKDVVDTAPTPLQQADRAQRSSLLLDSLQVLSPMYREVLVLYHFEHLKYVEIAELLGLPLGTVMNRIFRARRKLRTIYEDQGGLQ